MHQWDKYTLRDILKMGIPKPENVAPNNFLQTMPSTRQAMKAIRMFKDEYLLDYIVVSLLKNREINKIILSINFTELLEQNRIE